MASLQAMPTLSRVVATRIVLFAGLAMVVQLVIVLADFYFDDTQLADLMVERETRLLMRAITVDGAGPHYHARLGPDRYATLNGAYFARIRTPDGAIVYANCDASCGLHLLPSEIHPPDLWSRLLRPGKPIAVAGGRSYEVGRTKLFIEVAVLDDHDNLLWQVLAHELADHLAAPMSLMLVFILGGMLLSIRLALRPVERAARDAESIDPLDPSHSIALAGMPREIANLGSAVNRMLARINALMNAQRVYTTAIAHEIRTPLAMIKLELATIDEPRARKVEADLDTLTRFVAQITDLGRLEGADRAAFGPIDLAGLARAVVRDIAPWVYDQHHTIAFDDAGAVSIRGHASLVENAIRNLIENAVRHTPRGSGIQVAAGPGPDVSISDDAGLYDGQADESPVEGQRRSTGIGLEIVRRIMGLHRGTFEASTEARRRTTMRLAFEPYAGEPAVVRLHPARSAAGSPARHGRRQVIDSNG